MLNILQFAIVDVDNLLQNIVSNAQWNEEIKTRNISEQCDMHENNGSKNKIAWTNDGHANV